MYPIKKRNEILHPNNIVNSNSNRICSRDENTYWAFTGEVDKFYEGLRWKEWEKEIKEQGADKAITLSVSMDPI